MEKNIGRCYSGREEACKQAVGKAGRMTADVLSVLGTYWDEGPLRAFLTSLGISAAPKVKGWDTSGFLKNRAQGIELTFYREEAIKIRLRDYPKGALVLYNVRFYGEKSGRFEPYTGVLPCGLRFGASRDSLIQDLGPPAWEDADLGSTRWDTAQYSLFAMLSGEGILTTTSIQLPVVKTARAHLR
jgi:hypothetical protein